MVDNVHSCNEQPLANHTLDGYQNVDACTCAYCDDACPKPNVDASIGFFDGFDGALVGIVYGCLVAFSVIFQVAKYFYVKKKLEKERN